MDLGALELEAPSWPMRLEELVVVVLEVAHAWGVVVVVALHVTQACGAIVGVVLHHVIHACGDIGMVAHRGFFIEIILGSGVPRHDSQDQVLYMEVVEGVGMQRQTLLYLGRLYRASGHT